LRPRLGVPGCSEFGRTLSFHSRTRVMDDEALKCSSRSYPVALACEATSASISMGSLLCARNPWSDSVDYPTLAHTLQYVDKLEGFTGGSCEDQEGD